MALSLLRPLEHPVTYAIFGKLPLRPDFVRINATHPVATELDEHVQDVMELLRSREGWEGAYDEAGAVDCCYPSRDQRWLFLGSITPSRDQSSRRFPIIAGLVLPAVAIGGERRLLPIACEIYFEALRHQLASAVENSVEALACRQFLAAQASEWSAGSCDLALAAKIVERFMAGHGTSVLEVPLAAEETSSTLSQALINISFYRDFLRRFSSPSAIQSIVIPLPGKQGEALLGASAWMTLLAALVAPGEGWGGGFVLPGYGRLYASFGGLPRTALCDALGGGGRGEKGLDLGTEQRTWQSHKLYAEMTYAMDRLLADPAIHLSDLSAFLRECSQKFASSLP